MKSMTRAELLARIDHSLLRPDLTDAEIDAGLDFAATVKPMSVCIVPCHVKRAATRLRGTGVIVGTVVGFPHGAARSDVKAFEAARAVADGAAEADMVIQIGALRSHAYERVRADIAAVVAAIRPNIVKAILETAYLTEEEILAGAAIVSEAGAAFVKTSTGFGPSGANPKNVALLRRGAAPETKVKAAGGLRTLAQCLAVIEAGADRLGISRTQAILDEIDAKAAEAAK